MAPQLQLHSQSASTTLSSPSPALAPAAAAASRNKSAAARPQVPPSMDALLAQLKLSEFAAAFAAQDVEIEHLGTLLQHEPETLKELIPKAGPRMVLVSYIRANLLSASASGK